MKKKSLMEDKGNNEAQRPLTRQSGQWGSEWDEILSFGDFLKRSPVSDFMILKQYLILDGLILLRKCDFLSQSRSLRWFLEAAF